MRQIGRSTIAKSSYSVQQDVPGGLNQNLTSPKASFYLQLFGHPRKNRDYTYTSNSSDNLDLLILCKTDNVGPFRATGLKPAVDSFKAVLSDVAKEYPDLIDRLNYDGMLGVRYISGTTTLSNHSWGAAVDLKVDGIRDTLGDDRTLHGLALISPIFNKHGWYSGAGFKPKKDKKGNMKSSEDGMHFEVSKEKLLEWHNAGLLGPISTRRQEAIIPDTTAAKPASSSSRPRSMFDFLQKGDRGPKVVHLQSALKERDFNLKVDGVFGGKTETALMDFQRKYGLHANGIVGPKTAAFLTFF